MLWCDKTAKRRLGIRKGVGTMTLKLESDHWFLWLCKYQGSNSNQTGSK